MPSMLFNFTISGRVALDAVQPFAPTDIAGLKLWLKADSLGLLNLGPVSTWADSSGNGNHATQGTLLNQPLFMTGILNSNPVVRFDGSNDVLEVPSLTANSVFCVLNYTKAGSFSGYDGAITQGTGGGQFGGRETIIGEDATTNLYSGLWISNDVLVRYINGAASNSFATLSAFKLVSQTVTTPATGAIHVGHDRADAGRYWGGDIAEILIYDTALSTVNRQAVEDYLGTKYGITITH